MHKRLSAVLSLTVIILLAVTEFVSAQGFNSITTPDGINVAAVGNSGKFYRSANGGVTYVSTTVSGTPNLYSVTSFGNDVWMTGDNGNVIKTLKTASSNTVYNAGDAGTFNSVFFINSNTGFVCGPSGRVYKSINGGVNWSLSNTGISAGNGTLNSVSFTDENNGTIVANSGSIFVTNDGGKFWSLETSPTSKNLLKVRYFGNDRVAVGEFGTIITNTGSGWTNVNTRTRSDIKGVSGSAISDVHVCGGGGFIRNNKSGSSNYFNFENNPMMANLTDIYFYDNNKGWAVSSLNGVIIYTTNGGTNWSMPTGATVSLSWVVKTGASGNFLGNNLCQHPTDRNTFYCVFGGQVSVSRNRGETWSAVGTTIPSGTTPHSFFVSPLDTNIWLVATESSPDKVYRTTNYGTSWTQVLSLNFSSYGQPLEIDQNDPKVFYFAPDNGGFWKSINSGETFTEISGNYPFRSPCEILVTWDSSNIIILGDGVTSSSNPAIMFKSTNGGVNWAKMDSTSSSETPSMCNTVFDNRLIWCTEWGGSNIYKSTDMGSDYVLHHTTGFSGWGSDISREDPTMVITGSWGAAATFSTNGGVNWTTINTGLSGHGGGILAAERGLVLAQQGSNLYKLNIVYTDAPVIANPDVQPTSLNGTGSQYYLTATINPTGTVKNNNGGASATFTVTRTISPGGYSSTKTVTNLASSSTTDVTYDPWTFTPGSTYTIKDSVYMSDDINAANNVLSGSLTAYLGQPIYNLNQVFTNSYPPAGWTLSGTAGTMYWVSSPVSGYMSGTGCAKYDFYNAPNATNQSMFTETFTPTNAGDSLKFDHSYASLTNTAVDSLIIETSTNGGSTYSVLVKLRGRNTDTIGVGNTIKTVASTGSEFTPTLSSQWRTKKYILPAGTNKIKFRARSGFGNGLYVDNINISTYSLFTQYNIKLIPEGMYNGTTLNMRDTVKAYLRNINSPFSYVDSATAVIDSVTFNAPFVFKNAGTGSYYIQIIHRNVIEEWSKSGGESITKGITANYNFTSAQSQTYGNNSVLIGSKWCLYSGDVIKDGLIELSDMLAIYNDASVFSAGYISTDLTGDGLADLSDILVVYNNASNFVAKNTPETALAVFKNYKDKARIDMINYARKINSDLKTEEIKK
jgi:photosystem II stability/assembly factor-like uncharacterized protein